MFNVSELEFKEHVSIEVVRKFDTELNAIQKRYVLDWLNAEIESHYTRSMPTELFNAYCKMSDKANKASRTTAEILGVGTSPLVPAIGDPW